MSKSKSKLVSSLKKYVLEFLMLFLAVFLGFLADNYREAMLEKSKEKKYIMSLIQDVEADKNDLIKIIRNNSHRKSYLDSLSAYCYAYHQSDHNVRKLYNYYPIVLQRPDFFVSNELTMIQLKNAGGLRLINNERVVKEILQYDLQKALVRNQQEYYENYHNKAISSGLKIFNHQKLRTIWEMRLKGDTSNLDKIEYKLLKSAENLIPEFGNEINMYGGIVNYYNLLLNESNSKADSLIISLKEAYGIE